MTSYNVLYMTSYNVLYMTSYNVFFRDSHRQLHRIEELHHGTRNKKRQHTQCNQYFYTSHTNAYTQSPTNMITIRL